MSELPQYYITPWPTLPALKPYDCNLVSMWKTQSHQNAQWLRVLSAHRLSQNEGQSKPAPTSAPCPMDSVWTWNIFIIVFRYIGNHPWVVTYGTTHTYVSTYLSIYQCCHQVKRAVLCAGWGHSQNKGA